MAQHMTIKPMPIDDAEAWLVAQCKTLIDQGHHLVFIMPEDCQMPQSSPARDRAGEQAGNHARHLKMQGERDAQILARSLYYLWRYEQDGIDGLYDTKEKSFSYVMLQHMLDTHPTIRDSLEWRRCRWQPNAYSPALHYLFAQKDRQLATLFFETLHRGASSMPYDHAHLVVKLSETLRAIKGKGDKRGSTHQERSIRSVLMVRTWNALRAKKKVIDFKFLNSYPTSDARRKDYPDVQ